MEYLLVALLLAALLLLGILVARPRGASGPELLPEVRAVAVEIARLEGAVAALQQASEQRLDGMRAAVDAKLGETLKAGGDAIQGVAARLASLQAANERIVEIAKDLASLQSILASPKLRGNFGEFSLEQVLAQMLPADAWQAQAAIPGGGRVDVAIRLPAGLLPIDAKFPLEAWQRLQDPALPEAERGAARKQFQDAVRGRVDEIADRYVKPPATLDFALMYIPAEGVYQDLLADGKLLSLCLQRRVFPASPTTLGALFQALAIGFRGMRIEQDTKRVSEALEGLGADLERFKREFDPLGTHLQNASAKYLEAAKRLQRLDASVSGLKAGKVGEPA